MVDVVDRERPATAAKLVTTARVMLDEQGLDGLTLREIARRAEVSHGAPRRHFPTVALLLSAVAADGFRDLYAAIEAEVEAVGPEADARQRLAASGRGYVGFAVANPGVFSVMFHPERCERSDEDFATAGMAAFRQLAELVAAAQAEGFHPDVDTTQLASIVWSTVHGLSVLWIDGGGGMPGAGPGAGLDHFVSLSQSIVLGTDVPATTPGGTTP